MNCVAAGLDGTYDLHLFILIVFSTALLVELIGRITRNLKHVLFAVPHNLPRKGLGSRLLACMGTWGLSGLRVRTRIRRGKRLRHWLWFLEARPRDELSRCWSIGGRNRLNMWFLPHQKWRQSQQHS